MSATVIVPADLERAHVAEHKALHAYLLSQLLRQPARVQADAWDELLSAHDAVAEALGDEAAFREEVFGR